MYRVGDRAYAGVSEYAIRAHRRLRADPGAEQRRGEEPFVGCRASGVVIDAEPEREAAPPNTRPGGARWHQTLRGDV